ncbi:hypothetical protein MTO96_005089 [Rhipicephalus appendiculatus]
MDSRTSRERSSKVAECHRCPRTKRKLSSDPGAGLSIAKAGPTAVAEAIWFAAGIDATERELDTMCPNPMQNVMVVSTPNHGNTLRYTAVESIVVAGQQHDVSAYVAAPHATCKGVIRGISNGDGPEVIERNIVNRRNPLALGAKRIKNTGAVVVLFDGYKVPNYVVYGGTLVRCTLYRKQMDVCYTCGRLGHRSDVCPSPDEAICRGCGKANPGEQHRCDPKCKLCGGSHFRYCRQRSARGDSKRPTLSGADVGNVCATSNVTIETSHHPATRPANIFPNTTEECSDSRDRDPKAPSGSRDRSRSRGRRSFRSRSRSRGRSTSKEKRVRIESKSRSRSRSRSKGPQQRLTRRRPGSPTWDRHGPARERASKGIGSGSPPEHVAESASRIAQLERENALMQETINKLMSEITAIKKARGLPREPAATSDKPPQPMEVPRAEGEGDESRPPKKRAVAYEQESVPGRARSEIREMLSALSESVRQLGEKVSQMQSEAVLQAEDMNRRVSKMESFLENVVAPALIPSATVPPHTAAAPAVLRNFPDTDSCCKAIQKQDGQPK